MGNSQSSDHSQSIRSRTSRKGYGQEPGEPGEPNRKSLAVSFYQTPPGSFDLGRRPISSTSAEFPDPRIQEAKSSVSESDTESLPPAEELPQLRWKPGVYSLVNMRSGTSLDLSGADEKSIIGFPSHLGKNQQWRFEPLGEGYVIRNLFTGHYLTIEDGVAHESSLVGSPYPVTWKVAIVSEGENVIVRLLWPNERYAVSLANSGSDKACTKIHLETTAPNFPWQSWRLIEREDPLVTSPELQVIRQQQAVTDSTPVESVTVTEDGNNVTTTRTTTTSTVTTITTVTKTPRGAP